ncbi:MAG TPA: hypothetical protein VJM76_07020 [Gammaproteobacteria bacterium]|nr:hypothetical protein [Gammaproteobacteria bacterium]
MSNTINTQSVPPSETTQQEQKTVQAIEEKQIKEQMEKQKAEQEKARKRVEDKINSGEADIG